MENENLNNSFLENLTKNNGFVVPDAYFEESKEVLMKKVFEKKNAFTTPANYFENSKTIILEKTVLKTDKSKFFIPQKWKLISGLAALFIGVLSIVMIYKYQNKHNFYSKLNKINDNEMIVFLAANDVKIEWINELNIPLKNSETPKNIELEQYLLENSDTQSLIEEL